MQGKRRSTSRVNSSGSRMLSPSSIGLSKKKKKSPLHEGGHILRYTRYYPSEANVSEEQTVLSPSPSEITRGLSNEWTGLDRRWKMSQDALAKFGHLFKMSSRSEMDMRQEGWRIKSGRKRRDSEAILIRPTKPGLSEDGENVLKLKRHKGQSKKKKQDSKGSSRASLVIDEALVDSTGSKDSTRSKRTGKRGEITKEDGQDWHRDREDSLDTKRGDLRQSSAESADHEYDSHDRSKKVARRTSSVSLEGHGRKRRDKGRSSYEYEDDEPEVHEGKKKFKRQHSYESVESDDGTHGRGKKHKERSAAENDEDESRGHKRKSKRSHSLASMDVDNYEHYDRKKKEKLRASTDSREDELDSRGHKKKVKRSTSKEFSDNELDIQDQRRKGRKSVSKDSVDDDVDDGQGMKKRTHPSKDSLEVEYDSQGKRKKKGDSKDSIEDEYDGHDKRKKRKKDSKDSIKDEHDTDGERKKKKRSDSKDSLDNEYESSGKKKKRIDSQDSVDDEYESSGKKKKRIDSQDSVDDEYESSGKKKKRIHSQENREDSLDTSDKKQAKGKDTPLRGKTSLESRTSSEESSSTYTRSESISTDSRNRTGSSEDSEGSTDSDVILSEERRSKSKVKLRRKSTKRFGHSKVVKRRVVLTSDKSYVPDVKRFLLPEIPGIQYNRAEFQGWDFGTKRQSTDVVTLPGLPETASKLIDTMKAKRSDSMYDILFRSRADHTYGGLKDPQAGAAGNEAKLKPPQALRTYPGFYTIAKPITQYLRAERKQRLKTTDRDVLAGSSGLPDVQPMTSVTQERRSLPEATAPSGSAGMMKLLEITRFPAMPSQITSNQITDGPGMTPLSIQASPDVATGSAKRPLTMQEIPVAAAGPAKKPLSIQEISLATAGPAKKPLSIQEILPTTAGPTKKPLSLQQIPGAFVIPAYEQSSSSSWAASSTPDRRPLVAPDLSVLQGGPLLASQDRTVLPGIQPTQPRKQSVDPGMPSSRPAVPTIIIGWPPPLPTQPSPATASSLRENMAGIPGPPTPTSQKSSRYPASQLSEKDRQHIHGSILKEQSSLPAILPSTSRSHEQAFPTPGKSEKPLSLSEGDFRFAGTPLKIKDLQVGQAPSSAPYATPIPLIIEPPSIDVQLADIEDGTATRPFLDEGKASEVTTTTTPQAPSVLTAEAPSLFPLHIDMQGPCVDFFNVTRPDLVSMKYAARHGVEELLQFMMYSIVIHRPQDPIDFLIDLMRSIRHTMSLRRESARLVQDAKDYMIRTAGLTGPPKDAAPASTTDIFGQL